MPEENKKEENKLKETAGKALKIAGKAVGTVTFLTGAFVISSILDLGKDKKDDY